MNKSLKKLILILVIVASTAVSLPLKEAEACGSTPFLGEICTFAFDFCPTGYAATAGQLMSISQNTALFALLGTYYGGDGMTTFALPDLRSRTVVGTGQGAGLSDIAPGETGGAEQVRLDISQIPSHTHGATTDVSVTATLRGRNAVANSVGLSGKVLAINTSGSSGYSTSATNTDMAHSSIKASATANTTIANTGGGQPVDVRSPFLGLTYCIAVQGIFPSRN